ncbi:hypothetical protein N836_25405 [Leptolyngbya sp. Heron Island J]|nr:hypothetical protein [Leptolyngbya sp. Heron Island J]ESA32655.1 hypothetical protein N836_25405 [Leptolyngbya sp. Heron Island J]
MPFLPFFTVCLAFFLFAEVVTPKPKKKENKDNATKLLIELKGANSSTD